MNKTLSILALTISLISPHNIWALCADPTDEEIMEWNIINYIFPEYVSQDWNNFDYLIDDNESIEFQNFYNPYIPYFKISLNYGNLDEWAKYLGINQDQAYYLVNKSSKKEIDSLLVFGNCRNKKLEFANSKFCKKKKNALKYISYAKFLEPYMARESGQDMKQWQEYKFWDYYWTINDYYYPKERTVHNLDYETIINNLIEAYKAQKDKELKLRYGYQLVRLAHYKHHYEDAVRYFDTYVEPLKIKPEIYYYALSQKAGALNGLNKTLKKNPAEEGNCQVAMDFLRVFSKSKDLKYSAYLSLRFSENGKALENLYNQSKSLNNEDACSLYFLLGHDKFNNPLNELEKIENLDPNSTLADVLMARYISSLERHYYGFSDKLGDLEIDNPNLDQALKIAESMRLKSSHKDFWNLCAAHLNAYSQNYPKAKEYLSLVKCQRPVYQAHIKLLSCYIDILEPDSFDITTANVIFKKHQKTLSDYEYLRSVVAKRMENQFPLIAFLLLHETNELGLSSEKWEKMIHYGESKNHNEFEKWLLQRSKYNTNEAYSNLALSYLYENNIPAAYKYKEYVKEEYQIKSVLCYNIAYIYQEKSEDENDFHYEYIKEFTDQNFEKITFSDLLEELNRLYEASQSNDIRGAKAAFLLGNFYFNTSRWGYYRTQLFGHSDDCRSWENYDYSINDADEGYYELASEKEFKDRELMAKILFSITKLDDNEENGDKFEYIEEKYKNTKIRKEFVSKCSWYRNYVNE